MARDLQDEPIVVTGGSRGLGLAMVEALLARGARITVIARNAAQLADVEKLGAATIAGDATDPALMDRVVAEIKPSVLILNAGATPFMAPIDEQSWETFSGIWNSDVKAGLYGIQAALKAPLPPGSRVLIASSGAAFVNQPQIVRGLRLSGGYTGAKRTLWLMAHFANGCSSERGLGIRFQVLVPLQMVGNTKLLQHVAGAYAQREGVSVEAHLQARYGGPFSEHEYGQQVTTLLSDERYAAGTAFGFKSNTGITLLD
jgi:NAD(P)-dependent dehydrogenase (short-subunit alcohol dehydrogenase family)